MPKLTLLDRISQRCRRQGLEGDLICTTCFHCHEDFEEDQDDLRALQYRLGYVAFCTKACASEFYFNFYMFLDPPDLATNPLVFREIHQ